MIQDFVFYTAEEIANILKIHPLTVYEYIKTMQLKAVRIGRSYRIAKQDFMEFLKNHEMGTKEICSD